MNCTHKKGLTPWLMASALLLIAAVGLNACQSNPLSSAKTVDQRAYALYGTFVVFEEQAAAVIKQASTPTEVKNAIKEADAAAKPVADSLLASVREYLRIKAELAGGATSNDKLIIATANLERWVAEATPLIQNLVVAVGGK